jgi:lipopolysaccharide transport system ATP-binding protein
MSQSVTVPAAPVAQPEANARTGAPVPAAAPPPSDDPVMVRAQGLSKCFKIYKRPLDRLWEWTHLRKSVHTDFWAVRDVSFEVRKGHCLGIIGANGSGKSTLLKMLTGAMHPTSGSCSVTGRVLSLIELGTGLNPHLTGRQNIVNAAMLLGFPGDYARTKIDQIEAFAELGEFFDRETNLYSSGMRVRLAFAMFACFRPEVFMVDEALSVGDVFFQQKCAVRLRELLDDGMTMIFVSHDQSAVLNLCDEAILLQRGRVQFQGKPEEAVSRYVAAVSDNGKVRNKWSQPGKAAPAGRVAPLPTGPAAPADLAGAILAGDITGGRDDTRHGNGDLRIIAARVLNKDGRPVMQTVMGETLTFQVLIECVRDAGSPRAGLHLYDRFNTIVFAAGTYQLGKTLPDLAPGQRLVVNLQLTFDVQPGQYTFGLGCSVPSVDDPEQGVVCDRLTSLGPVIVLQDRSVVRPFHGIARLPLKSSHQLVSPGAGA